MNGSTGRNNGEIMVSVYCLTYNHEQYIRCALDGFISQKTDFNYEVFVHDDASTDGTKKIIEEYAHQYPEIIKPIFQTENQYSKGVSIVDEILFPRMKGRYIAMCEGDDYWSDENKLQRQVDFLEGEKTYSACVHNTRVINCRTGAESLINDSSVDMDLAFDEVVREGNAQFQLSSLVCRREFFTVPKDMKAKDFGDYPLAIYLMFNGKIRYMKEIMSVYRLFAKGSWTSTHLLQPTYEMQVRTQSDLVDFLHDLLLYSNKNNIEKEYCKSIEKVYRCQTFNLLKMENKNKEILNSYRDIYNTLSIKEKFKIRYPLITSIIKKMKSIRRQELNE